MHYSKEIKERIERYLDEVSSNIKDIPSEEKSDLLQCLREHIENTLSGLGIENPTLEDLEAVIEDMDPAESYSQNDPENKVIDIQQPPNESSKKSNTIWLAILTIVVVIFAGYLCYANFFSSEEPYMNKTLPISLKQELVLYFDFDKNESETVIDKSSKENNGILHGPTWTNEGKNGGAYHFEKKQFIVVENSNTLNPTKEITISAWVKPESIGSHRRILQKGDTDKQYILGGNCRFIIYKVGTVSGQVLRLKTWNHIVTTYDGSVMKIFADGKKISETKAEGKIPFGGYNLHIGAKKQKGAFIDNFIGLIDEVMIYNKALSEEDVKELYEIQK